MVLADTLSRAPISEASTEMEFWNVNVVHELVARKSFREKVKRVTKEDVTLQVLKQVISEGWLNNKTALPEEVRQYFAVRDELTTADDLLFRGDRIVLPKCLQRELMQRVNKGHLGNNASLTRARECVYRPNMSNQLRDFISTCHSCCEHDVRQTKEPMEVRDILKRPWQTVSADLFQYGGKLFLVTVDYFSDFFEMDELSSATSREFIDKLSNHFARYGIPELFIRDGDHNLEIWGSINSPVCMFEHYLKTPCHSQSNGKAKSAVKEAKRLLKKAASADRNPKLILLGHRNTATGVIGLSPAQRMFNRRMQTQVPTTNQLLQPTLFHDESLKRRLQEKQEKYQSQYDKHPKKMITLKPGDTVWVEPLGPGKGV